MCFLFDAANFGIFIETAKYLQKKKGIKNYRLNSFNSLTP